MLVTVIVANLGICMVAYQSSIRGNWTGILPGVSATTFFGLSRSERPSDRLPTNLQAQVSWMLPTSELCKKYKVRSRRVGVVYDFPLFLGCHLPTEHGF